MKIFGFKYRLLLIFITILFLVVDITLMFFYGFNGQLLIGIYVMIGIVPLCGVVDLCLNICIPTITINNDSKTITSDWIANELYKSDKHLRNQGEVFYFDEIISCEIDNNKLLLRLRHGQTKTLYLYFFTEYQIKNIKKAIDKNIK